jgi:phospholipid/cholesterol/gamma-HCH transport system substrate-binding protein
MRENVRNFSIGIVSATALGGLAFLLLKFGELTGFLEQRTPVLVALNAAGGLREGSLVTLHGVPVGLVEAIGFSSDDAAFPVRVQILVDRDTPIPISSAPVVESSLLGSGAKLELHAGSTLPGTSAYPIDRVPLLKGSFQPFDVKIIAAVDERLGSLRTSLEESLADFRTFATTYTAIGRNINDLIKPVDPASPDAEGNLRTTVARLNQALTDARDAIRLAREWLNDDALRANVRMAVDNANELLLRATDAMNAINGFATNLDADRSVLVARLTPVFDEARGAMSDVRRLLNVATTGDGTIGRLLNDPALYKDLSESARHLTATLDALQAVAEKLKAEGIILQF